MNDNPPTAEVGERALQKILDGVAAGLALPSAKWAAIVSDQEFQPLRFTCCHGAGLKTPYK
jgi:hypothetical protein